MDAGLLAMVTTRPASLTENTEYTIAGTRFSYPMDDAQSNPDVGIESYKKNFKGTVSFIGIDKETGHMNVAWQILLPGVNFDLARAGKNKSHDWFFFSCYNTEQANTLLEVNASQKDKDFIMAVNWKKCEENNHPYVAKGEGQAKVFREGNKVHVNMTSIRSHFTPDNIEGIKMGDEVYFHVTNLEQDWDVPHGFAIKGANNAELLIMPGETSTLKWVPDRVGVFPMYCTDFCSALHQEMQGYIRVSPAGSSVALKFSTGKKADVN